MEKIGSCCPMLIKQFGHSKMDTCSMRPEDMPSAEHWEHVAVSGVAGVGGGVELGLGGGIVEDGLG